MLCSDFSKKSQNSMGRLGFCFLEALSGLHTPFLSADSSIQEKDGDEQAGLKSSDLAGGKDGENQGEASVEHNGAEPAEARKLASELPSSAAAETAAAAIKEAPRCPHHAHLFKNKLPLPFPPCVGGLVPGKSTTNETLYSEASSYIGKFIP